MPEWTLCADQKVYARPRAVAKPAAPQVTRPGKPDTRRGSAP